MNDIECDFASGFGLSYCVTVDIGKEKSFLFVEKNASNGIEIESLCVAGLTADCCMFARISIQPDCVHLFNIHSYGGRMRVDFTAMALPTFCQQFYCCCLYQNNKLYLNSKCFN